MDPLSAKGFQMWCNLRWGPLKFCSPFKLYFRSKEIEGCTKCGNPCNYQVGVFILALYIKSLSFNPFFCRGHLVKFPIIGREWAAYVLTGVNRSRVMMTPVTLVVVTICMRLIVYGPKPHGSSGANQYSPL